jgi:hypothetical protein
MAGMRGGGRGFALAGGNYRAFFALYEFLISMQQETPCLPAVKTYDTKIDAYGQIMKITGFGSITSTTSTSKKRGISSTSNFADVLATAEGADTSQAGGVNDVAATAALNNLLALQEISEQDVRRRKLAQQGNNMLDALEKLRRQLLIGTLPAHVLQDLGRQLMVQKQMVDDPALNALIEDIELLAAVELAKIEKALENR